MKVKKNSVIIITIVCQLLIGPLGKAQILQVANLHENATAIPESAHLLSNYVKIPSESGNEAEAGKFLSNECVKSGLHVKVFTKEQNSYNFAASLYPLESGKPNIIFLNHIDVVDEGDDHHWKYPAYSGAIEDGYVWGRGSIDNKGMAVMQLAAITEFAETVQNEKLPFNVTLLSVSSEEVGGELGAKIIADSFLNQLNPVVILGEGGSGVSGIISSNPDQVVYGISVAQKRGLWLKLKLQMKTSGHGSIPPKEYVNKIMIEALDRLNQKKTKVVLSETTKSMFKQMGSMEKGIKGFALRNITLFKPFIGGALKKEPIISALVSNTITLTNISNPPASVNMISQEVEAILDCRLLPQTNTKDFIAEIRKVMKEQRISVEIINESQKASASKTDLFYDELSNAIKGVNQGSGVIPILFPAFNDNNYFRAKGIPVFGILPIHMDLHSLESIHNIDERLSFESLETGTAVYSDFLYRILDGDAIPRSISEINYGSKEL